MKKLIVFSVLAIFVLTTAFSSIVIWSSEQQVDFIRTIGERFARDMGINVEVQQMSFGDINSNFITAAQQGEGPDIIIGAHDWVGELVENNLIEPIPFAAIESDAFAQAGLDAFTFDGRLYGVPYAIEAIGLFYNKDYISEPPKNIEDLIEIAHEYTTDNTRGFLYDATNFYFSYPFISGMGGYVFDWDQREGYDPTDVGLANDGAVAGAELIKRFYDEGLLPQGVDYEIMDSMFVEGNAAMIINGPWAAQGYLDAGIDFGVLPLTELELADGKFAKPFVGVQGLMINSRSGNKAFAMEFILNYLATAEGIYNFYVNDPRLPSREDVSQIIEQQGGPVPADIVDAFIRSAAGGEPMPNIPEMQLVWEPVADALRLFTTGEQTPEEAMNDVYNRIMENIQ